MTRFPGKATFAGARVGYLTDPGVVRAENQDAVFVPDLATADTAGMGVLVAVADGMGGQAGGSLASSTAVDEMSSYYSQHGSTGVLDLMVVFRIEAANARLQGLVRAKAQLKGMGTTLTAGLFLGRTLHVFHIGDSRAYLFRGGKLEQLTHDHTLLARWSEQGTLLKNPRGLGKSVLTRALGISPTIEVDRTSIDTRPGDVFLFCSDGLHGVVGSDCLTEVLAKARSPWEGARALVDLACDSGGPDNVSAVVVAV